MSVSWRSTLSRLRALAHLERQHDLAVFLRRAEAVDAGDRGDDQHVAPLEEAARRREAQLLDLLVELAVLLDVGVGARDVGFRLVVVVVADEVLDGVVREELFELGVELRGERLVRREHERRLLHLLRPPARW